MGKTIFITGASAGLGKATAILFQSRGWNVIATMRNPEKESQLDKLENVTVLRLDVTDPSQIASAVEQSIALGKVDVVFNNAGYGLMGALETLTDEQVVRQVNTNLLGVIRVTQAFIQHFRQSGGGVFLSTTSMGGLLTFPMHSIYHATKFAVEGWSEGMSFELGIHNILIKTIAPGGISTEFLGRSLDRTRTEDYRKLEDPLFALMDKMMDAAAAPLEIAKIVYEAATDGKDQIRYVAGADANAMYNRRLEIGSEESRKEIRKMILG
ncbi:MAG: SDR family oxidoreductase [Chitinophagaceae bacterium]|nr:MAG: SDR family oxidoreductase [Chitinophagaceae bacterium]